MAYYFISAKFDRTQGSDAYELMSQTASHCSIPMSKKLILNLKDLYALMLLLVFHKGLQEKDNMKHTNCYLRTKSSLFRDMQEASDFSS